MSAQNTAPLGADFDRDGDIDVFQFIESERRAALGRNPEINEYERRPAIEMIDWFLDPNGSSAVMHVRVPKMPNGEAPDRIEVLLKTSANDVDEGATQQYRARAFEDMTGYVPGDLYDIWLPFPGELGDYASLDLRCFQLNSAGTSVLASSVDSPYAFERNAQGLNRGSEDGVDGGSSDQSGNGDTPPPPPPLPITD